MKLSAKIPLLVARRGISQAKLARLIGVHPSRISEWVHEAGTPGLAQALAMARELGVTLDYLADDALDEPPPAPPALTEREQAILGIVRAQERIEGADALTIEEVSYRLRAVAARPPGFPGSPEFAARPAETKNPPDGP